MKVAVEIPDELRHRGKNYRPTGEYRAVGYSDVFKMKYTDELESNSTGTSEHKRFIYEEVKPWRAETGEQYWYIDYDLSLERHYEDGGKIDTSHHETGNYFQTEAEANRAADLVRKVFTDLRSKQC